MPLFLMQNTPSQSPVTIDGALILLLLALVASAPTLLSALGKVLSAVADRLNAGTSAQVRQLDVFKILEDEVKHLREERDADQKRLSEAEKNAADSKQQADKFQRDLDTEKEKRILMQTEMNTMKDRLDSVSTDNKAKDATILQLRQRNIELEAENALLKTRLQTKELKWPESPSLSPPSDTPPSIESS